ncbi:MAG: hypothetical protein AB1450_09545 [Pseudomonadota bacterium]
MAKGSSGRIVIEIDPSLKSELYSALEKEGLNLKQWFLVNLEEYLKDRSQLSLFVSSGDDAAHRRTA